MVISAMGWGLIIFIALFVCIGIGMVAFVKGSGKKAADRCGTVDVDESMFDGIEAVGGDEG